MTIVAFISLYCPLCGVSLGLRLYNYYIYLQSHVFRSFNYVQKASGDSAQKSAPVIMAMAGSLHLQCRSQAQSLKESSNFTQVLPTLILIGINGCDSFSPSRYWGWGRNVIVKGSCISIKKKVTKSLNENKTEQKYQICTWPLLNLKAKRISQNQRILGLEGTYKAIETNLPLNTGI